MIALEILDTPPNKKVMDPEHQEVVKTMLDVRGNAPYYDNDGVRDYGDNEDHEHEPRVSVRCVFFFYHSCN